MKIAKEGYTIYLTVTTSQTMNIVLSDLNCMKFGDRLIETIF